MKKLLVVLAIMTDILLIPGADIDMYGKINMGIWYFSPERFYNDTIQTPIDTTVGKDSMDIIISSWAPYGTFGVKYKLDRFAGCIEMGTHMNMYDSKFYGSATTARFQRKVSDYIIMEKWFFEWYINDIFTLLLGKNFAPTNFFPSNQMFLGGENGLRGYGFNNVGCLSTGASPMVQLKIKSPNEKLVGKIAVIKTDTTIISIREILNGTDSYKCNVKIPKLEGGLKYNIEKGIFSTYGNFAGGYQVYESVLLQKAATIPKDSCYLTIKSYVVGGDVGIAVGPVFLAVDGLYGKNIGVYGAFVGDKFNFWSEREAKGERPYINKYMAVFYPNHDSTMTTDSITGVTSTVWNYYNSRSAIAFAFILKVIPTKWLALEGGFGMVFADHENEELMEGYHNTLAWYLQVDLKVFDILKITPEIGRTDYGPRVGYGRYLYWGLNTGIDF